MKKYTIVLLGILVVIVGAVFISRSQNLGAVLPNYSTNNSSTTCGVNTTSTIALAADDSLQTRFISNDSAVNVYLWFNSTSTGFAKDLGITLTPSTTLAMSDALGNLWTGNIYCATAAGTSTLTWTQW